MAEAESGAAGGYVAFISYSHKDAAVGRWLHRKLEGYRLPRRLAGTEGEDGEVPARLTPIFRDRDELPAAGDLSERVRAALAVSRNLIVVCSPNSAGSPWVAKEIATFRELHPDRPIFTAIVEGEPDQCFPPALREGGIEPLAADLRKDGDGRRLGLLKLVAGLAGVGLDALVQRDASRRVRRVTWVTTGAVAAMLAMALLTVFAFNARAEAQNQRAEAEGLVEFMLTDLRRQLKGVAGLNVLTATSRRALEYYQRQDLEDLTAESLERRASILHTLGEDDINRGNLDNALKQFREAARTTGALLAKEPDNPERIFAQAQSEFWIGHVDLTRRNFARARQAFQRYKRFAERLIEVAPQDPRSHTELAYAEGALCSVETDSRGDLDLAVRYCTASLVSMKRAAGRSDDAELIGVLSNRYGWLADVYRTRGDLRRAEDLRKEQQRIVGDLLKRDPGNLDISERMLTNQFSMAELEIARGAMKSARDRLGRAMTLADRMVRADPTNHRWASHRERVRRDLARLSHP